MHGHGSDPAVREALWGGPGFSQASPFYIGIQKIAKVRSEQAALRYGRFYFRPVSGDGVNFGISGFPHGVLAFSRILNDQEVYGTGVAGVFENQFKSNGGTASGYLATPEAGAGPGVVVIQEWWGLASQLKQVVKQCFGSAV